MKDTYILIYIDEDGISTYKYFESKHELVKYAKDHDIKGDIYKKGIEFYPHYIGFTK